MGMQLLVRGLEVGIVTRNPGPMIGFYRDVLGLELQGELGFAGGHQKRFALGASVLKLVTYDEAPGGAVQPGGGRASEGLRYVTLVVGNLREVLDEVARAGHPVVESLTEFQPGLGFAFIADPDGNWIELAGPLPA